MPLDPETVQRLLSAARTAQRRAYAPYSKFHVGAVVLTDRGRILSGCNVENASYGLTICAERNAVARAVAESAGRIVACLVVGPAREPLTPCGACRQVLYEFNPEMDVVCIGQDGRELSLTARELLPAAFGSGDLGKE